MHSQKYRTELDPEFYRKAYGMDDDTECGTSKSNAFDKHLNLHRISNALQSMTATASRRPSANGMTVSKCSECGLDAFDGSPNVMPIAHYELLHLECIQQHIAKTLECIGKHTGGWHQNALEHWNALEALLADGIRMHWKAHGQNLKQHLRCIAEHRENDKQLA